MALQYLANPARVEAKGREGSLQKSLTHLIIGPFHVKLDCHDNAVNGGMLKIMHELLGNKNIVRYITATNRSYLF